MPCRRAAMVLLAFTATAGTVVGCAPPATVRPVRLDADGLAVPGTPPTGYEAAVRSIAAVMARDLALPLPPEVTLYVSTRAAPRTPPASPTPPGRRRRGPARSPAIRSGSDNGAGCSSTTARSGTRPDRSGWASSRTS